MHRIAFLTSSSSGGWLGGANYLRNLLSAIRSVPNRRIEPVLFCPPDETEAVARLLGSPAPLGAAWLRYRGLGRALRSGLSRVLDVDAVAARTMQARAIACISHSGCFGGRFPIPVLNWLPDFQHRRLPDMFSSAERRQRDRAFYQVVRCSDRVIVSSNHAHGDLVELWPNAAGKSAVVPFAASLGDIAAATGRLALMEKYAIAGPYLYLPNQFWKHKNHALVIEALALLAVRGYSVAVVCSGSERDHRNPGHFADLMRRVHAAGLAGAFRCLGVVPWADVLGLMRDCIAVLNPSLFEGWSTSVEEARAMGKQIVLSDIAVHREQAPPRAIYFDPASPEALAEALLTALASHSPQADAASISEAMATAQEQVRTYGLRYQEVVLQAIEDFRRPAPRKTRPRWCGAPRLVAGSR